MLTATGRRPLPLRRQRLRDGGALHGLEMLNVGNALVVDEVVILVRGGEVANGASALLLEEDSGGGGGGDRFLRAPEQFDRALSRVSAS